LDIVWRAGSLQTLTPAVPYKCTESDFAGSLANEFSLRCRFAFFHDALDQCINGFDGITRSEGFTFSVSLSVPGYEGLGVGVESSQEVTVTAPGGVGLKSVCAVAASETSTRCREAKRKCLAKASGATYLLREQTVEEQEKVMLGEIDALIKTIDRRRLGLAAAGTGVGSTMPTSQFRPISRGKIEMMQLYYGRMKFLADWSSFLNKSGISPSQQAKAQQALQNGQISLSDAEQRYYSLLIAVLVSDPYVSKEERDRIRKLYKQFVTSGDFERRLNETELQLKRELSNALGTSNLTRFNRQVWPGIGRFVAFAPFNPRQTAESISKK
jgi:hypothetical protein